ncbi:hypothetical protein MMF94_11695 [Pseudonocardia alaniniphila]|uniref:Uncharacterized protein n=1 Tax=Pseudonocardia alaniniphila TaxID=75291 RepID=A0ABS9TCT1_9PSEU|nr:hypothetical protein [Pseudonocardia alaniniphila]
MEAVTQRRRRHDPCPNRSLLPSSDTPRNPHGRRQYSILAGHAGLTGAPHSPRLRRILAHLGGAGAVGGNFGTVSALCLRAPPLFSPDGRQENHPAFFGMAFMEASAKLRAAEHVREIPCDGGEHNLDGQTRR